MRHESVLYLYGVAGMQSSPLSKGDSSSLNLKFACLSARYVPVEDASTDGPGFAATPWVAARGPKTGAAVCV